MTIYDIAKQANVSPSTISRVINNKPGVSQAKREEIQRLLDDFHYEPNENAQNLGKSESNTIGILTDDLKSHHQVSGIVKIQDVILGRGYDCFVKYIGQGENAIKNSFIEMSRKRVDGVLLLGVTFHDHVALHDAIARYLPDVPIVLVHQTETIDLPNVYSVGADERKGIQNCVDALISRGRKNLLLIIDEGRTSEEIIAESFKDAVRKKEDVKYKIYTGFSSNQDSAQKTMEKLFFKYPEMDGILCASDRIAIGVMYALQDLGKRIPEDISIIGEDNSEMCEVCRPKLSSLDVMLNYDTVLSAHVLMDAIQGINRNRSISFEMEIVERETI